MITISKFYLKSLKYLKMKKTVLILLSLNFFLLENLQAQTNDSTLITGNYKNQSYEYLQLRSGILVGFQRVDNKDSVNITAGLPLEFNFRMYPKDWITSYIDLEMGYNFFVLNQNIAVTSWLV